MGKKRKKLTPQQARFKRAANKCKGKGKDFRPCMKKEAKKK